MAENGRSVRARHWRAGVVLAMMLAAAAQLTLGSARAAVVIGQAPPMFGTPLGCMGQTEYVQDGVAIGALYTVPPPGGVITEWRHRPLPGSEGMIALGVLSRSGSSSTYTVLATSEPAAITPDTLNMLPTRIPVSGGEVISLRMLTILTLTSCAYDTGAAQDTFFESMPPAPLGTPTVYNGPGTEWRVNVAAVIEPDADGDGFGDETQDQCTGVAGDADGCDRTAPETTLTKGAPNKTNKSKVKFKFTSDDPGATFECKADQKPYKPCTSPKKVKRLDEGKHKFEVRAVDTAGNVDPSAAKDKFKVVVD